MTRIKENGREALRESKAVTVVKISVDKYGRTSDFTVKAIHWNIHRHHHRDTPLSFRWLDIYRRQNVSHLLPYISPISFRLQT